MNKRLERFKAKVGPSKDDYKHHDIVRELFVPSINPFRCDTIVSVRNNHGAIMAPGEHFELMRQGKTKPWHILGPREWTEELFPAARLCLPQGPTGPPSRAARYKGGQADRLPKVQPSRPCA